jgi:two-component system OmpR family response regulator
MESASFDAIGVTNVVAVTDPEALPHAFASARAAVDALDEACSRFRADSELSRLNERGCGVVSPLLLEFVETALGAAAKSHGLVDPTVGAGMRGLGYDRDLQVLVQGGGAPSFVLVPATGWRSVVVDRARSVVRLRRGTELDLGATAKAFAADRIAAAAHAATGAGVLVSLGGDLAVAGPSPQDGWPVRVTDDHRSDAREGQTVAIRDGGLATSSTTVRRWRAPTARSSGRRAGRLSQQTHRFRWQADAVNDRARILVVDDEPSLVDAVSTALRYEGFEVEEATSGRDALAAAMRSDPDLVVLDWMLPDIEGIEVGRRLRERGFRTAILFLTAKDAVENKVEALRAGGDDYVTKPFSLAELVARVQAILRRTAGDLPGDVLRYDDLVLDEARHEVMRGDTRIDLTATEFNLLRFFMLNPRRVLSKGQILQNVWRYDFGGNANVVETYVSYLRRKLDAAGPPLIRTIRQAGYMLETGSE